MKKKTIVSCEDCKYEDTEKCNPEECIIKKDYNLSLVKNTEIKISFVLTTEDINILESTLDSFDIPFDYCITNIVKNDYRGTLWGEISIDEITDIINSIEEITNDFEILNFEMSSSSCMEQEYDI